MQPSLALVLTRRVLTRPSWWAKIFLAVSGSLLVAFSAQVSINLGFTPVPITGQTFAVLVIGAAYGANLAAATLILYVIEGLLGLPVFAGGAAGPAVVLGPTGGYLLGFIAAAYLVGLLAEHGYDRVWPQALAIFIAGEVVIYLFGLSWLSLFVGIDKALAGGLYPFVVGDLFKIVLAGAALPGAWSLVRRLEQ